MQFPRQPNNDDGWTIQFKYLCEIAESIDDAASLEEIELILLAVERKEIGDNEETNKSRNKSTS